MGQVQRTGQHSKSYNDQTYTSVVYTQDPTEWSSQTPDLKPIPNMWQDPYETAVQLGSRSNLTELVQFYRCEKKKIRLQMWKADKDIRVHCTFQC